MGSHPLVLLSLTSTKSLILIPVGAIVGVVVFRYLVRLERSDKRVAIVTVIFALVLTEALLYSQNSTPLGLFHPKIGSQNFRLYDVLIPLALLARIRVRGLPKSIGGPSLLLLAFFAWYGSCAITGLLNHNSVTNITFEAKAIIYVGGGALLAAGFSADELLGRYGPLRLVKPFAVFSALVAVIGVLKLPVRIPIPGVEVPTIAGVPADAASGLIALGTLAGFLECCRPARSRKVLIASAVMVMSTLTSGQRASLVQLVITVVLVGAACLLPAARRRVNVTPTHVLLVLMAVCALLIVPPLARGTSPWQLSTVPLGSQIQHTLGSQAKTESAQERLNEIQQLEIYVPERLLTGWGLGRTITYYATGTYEYSTIDISHDIAGDLLLRGGITALLLFVAAVGSSVWGVVRIWRRCPDRLIAAAALACAAITVGLLGKGAVESIFEKYRVAVILGLVLGLSRSIVTSASVPLRASLSSRRDDVGSAPQRRSTATTPSGDRGVRGARSLGPGAGTGFVRRRPLD